MADASNEGREAAPRGIASRVIENWALVGGLILLLVVLMNAYSVVAQQVGGSFPGDFEMTQMGVAVAAFSFLPYCQLTGSHVTADIFTSGASPRWIARFQLLASVIALGFACLLLWRMYAGMLDQKEYNYSTTILAVPHWWAYVPILFSLVLWIWACVITLRVSAGHAARR